MSSRHSRFKSRNTEDRKKIRIRLVNELVLLREQLVELQRFEAERYEEILALREAYEWAKKVTCIGYEPRLIPDAEPELASVNY